LSCGLTLPLHRHRLRALHTAHPLQLPNGFTLANLVSPFLALQEGHDIHRECCGAPVDCRGVGPDGLLRSLPTLRISIDSLLPARVTWVRFQSVFQLAKEKAGEKLEIDLMLP